MGGFVDRKAHSCTAHRVCSATPQQQQTQYSFFDLRTYVESPQLAHWCGQVEVLNEGGALKHVGAVYLVLTHSVMFACVCDQGVVTSRACDSGCESV